MQLPGHEKLRRRPLDQGLRKVRVQENDTITLVAKRCGVEKNELLQLNLARKYKQRYPYSYPPKFV
jgi:hypothetical protein|eukprot:COSAG01_NODE_132_length_24759_cov_13.862298_33_plen_66_part_00